MGALYHRIADRARWELREWRRPSTPSFAREELDQVILREIRWPPGSRTLDLGCGNGGYLAALARQDVAVTGLDVNVRSLHRARAAGAPVVAGTALSLPFADGAFDSVLAHRTLYLLSPPENAAREIARVLRPGGRVVFSGSNVMSPYARVQDAAIGAGRASNWRYGNRWSVRRWCQAFARHGLVTRSVYSCNLVWPIVFRVCDRWLAPNEWMRRYARFVRRATRTPLAASRLLGAAQDYVVEMTKSSGTVPLMLRPIEARTR